MCAFGADPQAKGPESKGPTGSLFSELRILQGENGSSLLWSSAQCYVSPAYFIIFYLPSIKFYVTVL